MTMVLPEIIDEVSADRAQSISEMSRDELRSMLISQIQLECAMAGHPIDPINARDFLTFMEKVIKVCLKATNRTYHLRSNHIMHHHHILEIIMPDDVMPVEMSAHDILNLFFAVPDGMTFMHTKDGHTEAADCVVKIVLVERTR